MLTSTTIRRCPVKTKKKATEDCARLPNTAGEFQSIGPMDCNASKGVINVDLPRTELSAPESVTGHIQEQTLRAFLDAVNTWGVSDSESARLVGAEPASVEV